MSKNVRQYQYDNIDNISNTKFPEFFTVLRCMNVCAGYILG